MRTFLTKLSWMFLILFLVGCAAPAPTAVPDPTAVPPAPELVEAEMARDQVLDYIRQSANECVPPEGVQWVLNTAVVEAQPPTGFDVYRFTSEGCEITVSFQSDQTTTGAADAPKAYHVALGDATSGFCWQAVIDENGEITRTGRDAANLPGLGNPAAIYCEEQGFRYEISTDLDGSQCGQCIFSDALGDACNAWQFFHGTCGPAEN